MGTRDNEEFKVALRDIAAYAHELTNPYDRVRCSEWVRKLAGLRDDNLESSKLRNHYLQFLRIQVRNKFLHGPFTAPPPESDELSPLAEHLGNMMAKQIPYLPRSGPISPMLYHQSPDGRAFVSAQQIPGGGVLCYMAVSPEVADRQAPELLATDPHFLDCNGNKWENALSIRNWNTLDQLRTSSEQLILATGKRLLSNLNVKPFL